MQQQKAGTAVVAEDLIDVAALEEAYYTNQPCVTNETERVSFGTSGHRGKAETASFTDWHVAAITQAICDGRERFGATGGCFVGRDTHALSQPAYRTVLEVLAGNGVEAYLDIADEFVPTPSLSRAILRENMTAGHPMDGIIITPSHNPPEQGGIKYNPPHGGPAEQEITAWIEERANAYMAAGGEGIRRHPYESIPAYLQVGYAFKEKYVEELSLILNMEAIQNAQLPVVVDALGGSGAAYWQAIRERYGLNLTILHSEYDPTFSFMRYDHDGQIRMDCSSAYAMGGVIEAMGDYVLAVGNDPDYDRYGVVTKDGLMNANAFFVTAAAYLFTHRAWQGKGIAKSLVVTGLVERWAATHDVTVYETPVGFKYFVSLLYKGVVGIAGEESAGASFLTKEGTVWTTDKDGIIMALLAMEMMAVTGQSPSELYTTLTAEFGRPYMGRYEAACSAKDKQVLKKMSPSLITAKTLQGKPLLEVRNTATYDAQPIGGIRLSTAAGWLVARPSGTEDLYKIYGECFGSEQELQGLLSEGQQIVAQALAKTEK